VAFVAFALLALRPSAGASVLLEMEDAVASDCSGITLFAMPQGGTAETPSEVGRLRMAEDRRTATYDGPLPTEATGRFIASGCGLWAESGPVREGGSPIVLEAKPAGTLMLSLAVEDGQDSSGHVLPGLVGVRLWREGARGSGREAATVCRRDQDHRSEPWTCVVPVGAVDLRIDLPGLAPVTLWHREISAAATARAEVALVRGAEVHAWIDGPPGVGSLRPAGAWQGLSEDRIEFVSRFENYSSDGHLRFDDVRPGAYDLIVESPGYAVARTSLRVEAGSDRLRVGDLSLVRLGPVPIQLEPPLDSAGRPWEVTVAPLETADRSRRPRKVTLDRYGWGEIEEIRAGAHHVLIRDSGGSQWDVSTRRLEPYSTLLLEIPSVEVEGSIHAGDEPIRATLIFGTTQGTNRIRFESDEDGAFGGFLPREGRWDVELGDSTTGCDRCGGQVGVVAIPPLDVDVGPSGKAFVEIAVPDTEVHGRVVESSGGGAPPLAPVSDAQILVVRTDGSPERRGRKAQVWTNEDGEFSLRGLEPGSIRLGALSPSGEGASDWLALDVREGEESPEVELVIVKKADLVVRVLSASGPVAGVRVHAFPEGGLSSRATSGLDGRATLRVPVGSHGLLLAQSLASGVVLSSYSAARGEEAPIDLHASAPPGSIVVEGFEAIPATGWLVSGEGEIPFHLLRNFAPSHVSAGDGRLRFSNLQPGAYSVCLWTRERCVQAPVPVGGMIELSRSSWNGENR
jgi:hypothetical protein